MNLKAFSPHFYILGTIPPIGVSQTLTACEVGFSSNCTRRYPIEVKNCTNFLVYNLKALDLCNSAYCFGNLFTYMQSIRIFYC